MSSSDERFEQMMRDAIAPNIEPDSSLNEMIMKQALESKKAKVTSIPKLIAVVAIVTALGSASVYAGVQIHKKLMPVTVEDNTIRVGMTEESTISNETDETTYFVDENPPNHVKESYDSYDEALEKSGAGLHFTEPYQPEGTIDVTYYEVDGEVTDSWLYTTLIYKDGSFSELYHLSHNSYLVSGTLPYDNPCNEREYVAPNDYVYTLVDCESYGEKCTDVVIAYNYKHEGSDGWVECDLLFMNLSDEDIHHVLDTIILPEEASQTEEQDDLYFSDGSDTFVDFESYEEARKQTGLGVDFSEKYEIKGVYSINGVDDNWKPNTSLVAEIIYKSDSIYLLCGKMTEDPDEIINESAHQYVSENGDEYTILNPELSEDHDTYAVYIYYIGSDRYAITFNCFDLSEEDIHQFLDTVILPEDIR